MKKTSAFWLLVLFVGCSTGKVVSYVNDDAGITRSSTFGLVRSTPKEELTDMQREMDSLMLKALKSEFENLGYQTSRTPDLFVSYQVVLNNTSESRVNQPSYYDRRNYYPYGYNYNVTTYEYREGVIIAEAKDANGKLLWQGSRNFKVGKSKKVSTKDLLISTLREVAASFPPKN